MAFWDRQLSRPAPQPGRPEPVAGITGQPFGAMGTTAPQVYDQPSYVRDQLAVRQAGVKETHLAQHIWREGYISRPPSWVQRQPRDTCPNCHGPDLAAVSNGGYSKPGAPGTILRCFDCNWSSSRGVSALWGAPASGPVVGAAIQSRDGHVPLRNTGLISG